MTKSKISIFIIAVLLLGICLTTSSAATSAEKVTGEKTIEDGTYIIKTALDENYVLDIGGASTENGGNVQLWSSCSVPQQRYKVKYLGNGCYSMTAEHSNRVLDVAGGSMADGANVQQFGWNATDAQKWIIKDAGDGYYYIISKLSYMYLTVAGGKAELEANIQVNMNNNSEAQKFKFKDVNERITGTQTVADGTYTIKTALDENYVLDIGGASTSDGGNVQLWSNCLVPQQRYKVKYLGNGCYSITVEHSNKVLDVAGGSMTDGANVQQFGWNGTDAQKWIIKDAGDGYYYIISRLSSMYLTVANEKAGLESNIQVNIANNSEAQKFKFKDVNEKITGTQTVADGTYIIKTALNENYVLDIGGASKADGGNVQIWNNCSVAQQKYKVKYVGNGYYSIVSAHSNKSIDVAGGSKANGANVQQFTSNGTDAQRWIIKDAGDGYYYIISKLSNLYVTVAGGQATAGSNVQVNIYNNTKSQKFKFEKANYVNIDSQKYPGYKEKIENLMEQYPNWNFEFLYTGINFSDAVAGEYAVRSANLVPTSYGGEWISGTTLYDTGWYGASEKAIARFMDPRNFLNEVDVFQFQDVNDYLYGVCALEGIQEQVNNSFLKNYATDIDTACKNENVNPYYIIARLFQENGKNPSNGTYKMDGGDGKYYYNPFNIGATGNTKSEVYNNALTRAKREGWDTMVKALQGGIYFCKKNWLENYQNTLYQNKFDIDSTNGTELYSHQYMQNLFGAYNEAKSLQGMYKKTDRLGSNFTFIIPLYENMPKELSPEPSNKQESYVINVRTTGTQIRIRADASTDSAILREIANKGTVLLSVQRGINSNWHKVITQDGLIGYVSGTYLEQIDDVKTCNYSARVKTNDGDGCYIRIGPSTNLDKITGLSDGTYVTVIDDSTYKNINEYDWSRILLSNGTQAFMPSKFLEK